MKINVKSNRSDWLIPLSLVALSIVPAIAGAVRVAQLTSGAQVTPDNARFFASPLPVLLHIPAVIVFSMVGAFQFSPGLRRKYRSWHRTAGKLLIACGIIVALSGLWMAQFYSWPAGDGVLVYVERLLAGSWMLWCIAISIQAIRQRTFTLHGTWMMRAYAVALGAGTQVFTHLPWFVYTNVKPGETPRAVMMGAGWVINVVVAELIIRRMRLGKMERIAQREGLVVP